MKKDYLATALSQKDYDRIECNKAEYIEYLKYYFYVGGMPQAVSCFAEKKDFYEVWYIQNLQIKVNREMKKYMKKKKSIAKQAMLKSITKLCMQS